MGGPHSARVRALTSFSIRTGRCLSQHISFSYLAKLRMCLGRKPIWPSPWKVGPYLVSWIAKLGFAADVTVARWLRPPAAAPPRPGLKPGCYMVAVLPSKNIVTAQMGLQPPQSVRA